MKAMSTEPGPARDAGDYLLANRLGATWFFMIFAVLLVVRIWHVRRRRK